MRSKAFLALQLAALLCVSVATSGCFAILVGAAAGAGGVAYAKGELEKVYDRSTDDLYNASLRAVKSLELKLLEEKSTTTERTIVAQYLDGKKVSIVVRPVTKRSSKLKIRVGVFGDEVRSTEVLQAIEKRL